MLCVTNLLFHNIDTPKVYHDNSLLKDVLDYTEDDCFDVILMNPPYGGSEKNEVKNHFPSDLAGSETADLFMSVIMYRLKQNGRAAVIRMPHSVLLLIHLQIFFSLTGQAIPKGLGSIALICPTAARISPKQSL